MYFNDLGISVQDGEKFDIYENGVLTGTLIDDDSMVIGLFRAGKTFISKKRSFFSSPYKFEMIDDVGQSFASGETDNDSNEYFIRFADQQITFNLSERRNPYSHSKYRMTAEFYIGGDVFCEIDYKPFPAEGGWFKKNFGSSAFKGVIRCSEGLDQNYILGFLLLLNRKIAVEGPKLG